MTATMEKTVIYTQSGRPVSVWPSTAKSVSPEEVSRKRAEWLARNKPILGDWSSDDFIVEKRRDVEAGLL